MTAEAAIADGALAAVLFAIDPVGLGGVVVRSGAGPVRDRWMAAAGALLPGEAPMGRLPLGVSDDRLLGGLDLSASLSAGRPVVERGVLASHDGGVVVLPMAERIDDAAASKVAAVLDSGEVAIERDGLTARLPARLGLILLDEGAEPEERPPAALLERMAFRLDLHGIPLSLSSPPDLIGGPSVQPPRRLRRPSGRVPADGSALGSSPREMKEEGFGSRSVVEARSRLADVAPIPDDILEALCAAAAAFGLDSIRPPLLAARAARAHAALVGRETVTAEDAAAAVRLVLAPRALTLPAAPPSDEEPDNAEEPPPELQDDPPDPASEPSDIAEIDAETLVAAAQALLPDDLLERIVVANQRSARTPRRGGAGEAAKSAQRGRPVGSRPGALRPGDRLNLPETLRAATPWQRLRARDGGGVDVRIRVRAEDFRIRRFVQQRESTTIFVVDASGSAAFQRLAEAKGAVELLLAKAYVSRARVALVAFRAAGAEVLLAPTKSLTRAKRSLADLPGGGGTPLASGLDAALALALAERVKDRTPLLVVLTDGRANVGRDGAPGRAAAEQDALAAAARIGEARIGAAFLDTSPRPQPGGDRFAHAMGAVYAPLPYADAGKVSAVVDDLRASRG